MARKEELELLLDVRQLELTMIKPDCWLHKEVLKDIEHMEKHLADLENFQPVKKKNTSKIVQDLEVLLDHTA